MPEEEEQQKPRFLWDYLRGGRGRAMFGPINRILNRNSPENLQRKLDALKLKREINKVKKSTDAEKRVAA